MDTTIEHRSLRGLVATIWCCVLLAGCAGRGSHGSLPSAIPLNGTGLGNSEVPSIPATFTFTYPKTSSSSKRRTRYLSSATASVTVTVTDTKSHGTATDIFANVPAALKATQSANFGNTTGNPNTAGQCGTDPVNTGNIKCTAVFQLPVGDNTVTISSFDAASGGGNKLSQQIVTVWTQQGMANAYSVSLDANATTMAITATSGFCAGSFTVVNSGNVGTVGTQPVTLHVTYKDLGNTTIVAPGLPLLTVNGHTDNNPGGGGTGYTDGATGLKVSVNQTNQTFTLTQTHGSGNAAVTVTATPPSSDGLSFNNTLNFTLQSGAAPTGSLLADAEQKFNTNHAVTGGQISLFNVTLGTTDSISPYTTATLASQPVTGPAHSDVDFPNDLLFDGNGDLMIANGGSGNPDFGNFSCVPAGSISTGANNVTVIESNVDDPVYLALGTDGSIAMMNLGVTNNYPRMVQFVLGTAYTAAPPIRNIPNTAPYTNLGVNQVVALPITGANPAGTFAGVITNGTTSAGNHVVIKRPATATPAELPQDADAVNTFMGYDAKNNQLVLAGKNAAASKLTNWSVATLTKVGSGKPFIPSGSNSQAVPSGPMDVSPDGHVAVAVGVSGPEVIIYDNDGAGNRTELFRIPFDAVVTRFGSDYVYGGTNAVNIVMSVRWLVPNPGTPLDPANNKKLLVAFQSSNGMTPGFAFTGANGLYIFDISQSTTSPTPCTSTGPGSPVASFDPFGNAAISPKLSGCKQLTNGPVAAAFKP